MNLPFAVNLGRRALASPVKFTPAARSQRPDHGGLRRGRGRRAVILTAIVALFLSTSLLAAPPVRAAGPPAGIAAYVPIKLTNSQTSPTPSSFQQQLTVDWNTYRSYLAANVQNVEFFTSQWSPLYAWCESSCSSSATSSSVWVNLGSNTIAASGGTLTIVMGFYSPSTNKYSSTGYWGAYPGFTSTYAQYDNGANVFDLYFNGNTATSSFNLGSSVTLSQKTGVTGPAGSAGKINVLSLSGYGASNSVDLVFTKALSNPAGGEIAESSFEISNSADKGHNSGAAGFCDSTTPGSASINCDSTDVGYSSSLESYTYVKSGAATAGASTTGTDKATTWYYAATAYPGKSSASYSGYVATSLYSKYNTATTVNPISGSSTLYWSSVGASPSAAAALYFNWGRARAYPPAGIMPAVSFGSASSSSATPVAYSSPCTTSSSSFDMGQQVYGGFTVTGSGGTPWALSYINQAGGTVKSVAGITSSPYCDAAGYTIPLSGSSGTWTLEVLDTNGINIGQTTFTVQNVAIPDLPSGAIFLVIPVVALYLMMRRRGGQGGDD